MGIAGVRRRDWLPLPHLHESGVCDVLYTAMPQMLALQLLNGAATALICFFVESLYGSVG